MNRLVSGGAASVVTYSNLPARVRMSKFDFPPLLRYLLTRLVRIAIHCGISYQAFSRLLREVYFEVAESFEPVRGKSNSDSRISVLTGLPRREVRALREQVADEPLAPAPSFERLLLDAWSSRLDLLDPSGDNLPLHRTIRRGGERSFEALVKHISKDVRPRSVLDEWLRKGYVVIDDEDRVVLTSSRVSVGGVEGAQGAAMLLSELIHDLLAGFEQSYLLGQGNPGYTFNVTYGHRLTVESVQMIHAAAYADGMQMTHKINRMVVEREALDASRPEATRRVLLGFGVYQTEMDEQPGLLGKPQVAD